MKIEPKRTIRYYFLKFQRLRGNPHYLARGVAVGIFIGITPTIPLHTVLAIVFSFVLRGSKLAALLATVLVSNPLTFFFQYYFSWRLGSAFTSPDLSWGKIQVTLEYITNDAGFRDSLTAVGGLGQEAISTLVLGGCLLAAPFTLGGYFLSLYFFSTLQKRRALKQGGQQNSTLPDCHD